MDQLRGGSCDHPGLYQVPLHLHLCLSNLITATSVPLPLSEKSALLTREIYIWGPCSTGNFEGIHKQCVSGALVPCRIFVVCCFVSKSCPTLCDPMDCSMPGFPMLLYLMEIVQTHVHWVGDAIQPSHPLSSSSAPTFNLSQHQGHFKWASY